MTLFMKTILINSFWLSSVTALAKPLFVDGFDTESTPKVRYIYPEIPNTIAGLKKEFGKPKSVEIGSEKSIHDPNYIMTKAELNFDGLIISVRIHPNPTTSKDLDKRVAQLNWLEITSPKFKVIDGVRVGATLKQVTQAIGQPSREYKKGHFMFTKHFSGQEVDNQMNIILKDGVVVRMVYLPYSG